MHPGKRDAHDAVHVHAFEGKKLNSHHASAQCPLDTIAVRVHSAL
jgi:hypothetical protein